MVRKTTYYSVATFLVFGVAIGGFMLVFTGETEPYVSLAELPGGPLGGFAAMIGTVLGGVLLIRQLKTRAFVSMGRQVSLKPEGGGLLGGKPVLTGCVRGRPVRVETYTVSTGSGGEAGGGSSQTHTVVQTELPKPTDVALLIAPSDQESRPGGIEQVPGSPTEIAIGDGFVSIGTESEDFASDVFSPRVRAAFKQLDRPGALQIGDLTETYVDMIPDMVTSFADAITIDDIVSRFRTQPNFDDSRVSVVTKGLLLDPDELERQLAVVLATVDSFEKVNSEYARA